MSESQSAGDSKQRKPSLESHLLWLNISDCTCPHEWRSLGRLYGVSFGKGWVRMTTDSKCPHHGEK